ncbi:hypothetical protein EVAR_75668_1 [Eumeta japonica]|uniref:Uncharacterized protein n=1 Tax=Eumeta variegata TaxID=151549 RepID=A0A4C1U1J1_EUMVA|nr:hypothetical protein EVAR_75668_1 [Eumeta japonica]
MSINLQSPLLPRNPFALVRANPTKTNNSISVARSPQPSIQIRNVHTEANLGNTRGEKYGTIARSSVDTAEISVPEDANNPDETRAANPRAPPDRPPRRLIAGLM